MRFEFCSFKKIFLLPAIMSVVLAGCYRPMNDGPDYPDDEPEAAVYSASITLAGDTELFVCGGSFFALPSGATDLYDAGGNALTLKNGIYYVEDIGDISIHTSEKAEYLCGRLSFVIRDTYDGALDLNVVLKKNRKTILSGQYKIPSSKIGATLFFESDKDDISFELMAD